MAFSEWISKKIFNINLPFKSLLSWHYLPIVRWSILWELIKGILKNITKNFYKKIYKKLIKRKHYHITKYSSVGKSVFPS